MISPEHGEPELQTAEEEDDAEVVAGMAAAVVEDGTTTGTMLEVVGTTTGTTLEVVGTTTGATLVEDGTTVAKEVEEVVGTTTAEVWVVDGAATETEVEEGGATKEELEELGFWLRIAPSLLLAAAVDFGPEVEAAADDFGLVAKVVGVTDGALVLGAANWPEETQTVVV